MTPIATRHKTQVVTHCEECKHMTTIDGDNPVRPFCNQLNVYLYVLYTESDRIVIIDDDCPLEDAPND